MVEPVIPSSGRWRRRKEARPGEIVEAALEVFTAKGFAATRLDDVAARAGVSKGTLYLYFSSKEELFKAVVRQTVLPNLGSLEALVASYQGTTADLFRDLLIRATEEISATKVGLLPKLIIAEAGAFPDVARFWVTEVVERGQGLLRRVVARGVASGEFTPVQSDAMIVLFAPVVLLTLWNAAIGPAVGRMLDPAIIASEAARILLDGLNVRKEAS